MALVKALGYEDKEINKQPVRLGCCNDPATHLEQLAMSHRLNLCTRNRSSYVLLSVYPKYPGATSGKTKEAKYS
jgi:hypothetical protein